MNETKHLVSVVYDYLENNKCLCKFISERNTRDFWNEIFHHCFEKEGVEASDSQVLCISFLGLTGEVYINVVLKYQNVCNYVHDLFEIFSSDELWTIFVNHLKFSQDKYLIYVFIKSVSTILSASYNYQFSHRIKALLDDIKDNIFIKLNMNVLDFLSNLALHNFKAHSTDFNIDICNNFSPRAIILFKDLFQSLCIVLSQYWSSFMQQYYELISSKCENENLISFLLLWQRIVQRLTEQDLFHIFLNEDSVITFLSHAYNLDVLSLRIYVDIIAQFFISRMKFTLREENYNSSFEKAVATALERKFFDLLPTDIHLSGLCILINSKSTESVPEPYYGSLHRCDSVIMKKITFIFLNLIAGFKMQELICSATLEVFNFVKQNSDVPSSEPVHVWINNVFVDQDDILLGIMFALLKIYINLKEKSPTVDSSKQIELQNYINPHEIFIHFLQKLGFDYNELIAFLTSDETCFLHYLMKYLKLLLQECDMFIKAHDNLIKVDEEVFESISASTNKNNQHLLLSCKSSVKKLVSYSSSSSEGETSNIAEGESRITTSQGLIVVITLGKLKEALKKLVASEEFPYNVSPLIILLQTCENQLTSEQ